MSPGRPKGTRGTERTRGTGRVKDAKGAADTERDAHWMGMALREAARGRPSPNPHVGAVVVKNERLIARGYHRRAGDAHAEAMALSRAGRKARGATLYVTLEPCNHHGRTGPCTEAVLEAGIARVVIGYADPAPHVAGAIRRLRRAGLTVTVGVRRDECSRRIADFEKHIKTGLPYVTLKAAVTLDGRIAARSGDSRWITNEASRKHAHRLRDRSDAVMVGAGTVLADDPRLDVRHLRGRDPLRVVLDSRLRTPVSSRVLPGAGAGAGAEGGAGTLIFHGRRAAKTRIARLTAAGATLIAVPERKGRLDLRWILEELGRRDVVRLLVEGGATLHGAFLDGAFVDRAAIFIAPKILGDAAAVPLARGKKRATIADAFSLKTPRFRRFGDDLYIEGEL